jgi:hypothetical protein
MGVNPFELALGIEDLVIPKTRGECREGGKNVEEMARKFEWMNTKAKKLLVKT